MIKCCANQFPDESRLKNKVWELYLLYPVVRLLALPWHG